MLAVPYNADIEREVDANIKGIYAACQAAVNGTPLLGYFILMDENGNPITKDHPEYAKLRM
jgi:hypothetical protein